MKTAALEQSPSDFQQFARITRRARKWSVDRVDRREEEKHIEVWEKGGIRGLERRGDGGDGGDDRDAGAAGAEVDRGEEEIVKMEEKKYLGCTKAIETIEARC